VITQSYQGATFRLAFGHVQRGATEPGVSNIAEASAAEVGPRFGRNIEVGRRIRPDCSVNSIFDLIPSSGDSWHKLRFPPRLQAMATSANRIFERLDFDSKIGWFARSPIVQTGEIDMWSCVRNRKRLAVVATFMSSLVLWAVLWTAAAPVRGQLDARFEIARGHYEVLGYGLPAPWRAEYVRLLRERYGIDFRPVALCIVSRTLVAYVAGYNGESTAAANRKFGHDVFEECVEDARKSWQQSLSKSVKK